MIPREERRRRRRRGFQQLITAGKSLGRVEVRRTAFTPGSSSASFSGAAVISSKLESLQEVRTLARLSRPPHVWLRRKKNELKRERGGKKKRRHSLSVQSGEQPDPTFVPSCHQTCQHLSSFVLQLPRPRALDPAPKIVPLQ